ncbi:probable methyltransferase At1g29790 [Primulina huaijiensis]|uniref:probable methyltransferase At1g29790 n=1 Tax=Primulina huaijiensis TaxID=1492673 RepID=UPI003CC77C01
MGSHHIAFGGLFIIASISSLSMFYLARFLLQNEEICMHSNGLNHANEESDDMVITARLKKVLDNMERLQAKLESTVQQMEKNPEKFHANYISGSGFKKFLEKEVIRPLYSAYIPLMQIQESRIEENKNATLRGDPMIKTFVSEELKKYITPKENRVGTINLYETEKIYSTMGYGCVSMKKELEEYMDYEIGSNCKDDWNLGQTLMIQGCDPLPRRRCLAKASKLYLKPYSINESLWRMPEVRNVRWSNYQCKNFECLAINNTKHDYSPCTGCFDMAKEKLKWINHTAQPIYFVIKDVLALKPGEIRIGLDFSIGTGTFAARMREQDVTIVSMAMNLGAPFNEMIALRGLIPLYVTLNQRLPFFDNTMDLIHTKGVLDGWTDLQSLDFVMFDLDRVLRPGGLLWIDGFFCKRKDLDEYLFLFLQFGYRKHMWAVAPKSKDEVFLSGLLEKSNRG